MKVLVIKAVVASVALCLSGVAAAGKFIVLIESWRAEDQAIRGELILPVFE